MRFEPRHAFRHANAISSANRSAHSADYPPEISFLREYLVDDAFLRAAADAARREGTCAARALIAQGDVSASLFYRALAHYLGLPFVDTWPLIEPVSDLSATNRDRCVRLMGRSPAPWLVAPTDDKLITLIRARQLNLDLPDIAMTTPHHLTAIIRHRAEDAVEYVASEALPRTSPHLSARDATNRSVGMVVCLAAVFCILSTILIPRLVGDVFGLLFLAGICFRLVVSAAGLAPRRQSTSHLRDADLPFYTVLVPLHQEVDVIPQLVAGLRDLDYPTSKLEIFMLVEPEDSATRTALAAMRLPSWFHVIVSPTKSTLRTKPRVLNIGLALAHGSLLTVYDAEDRPDPSQLRQAAERFDRAPETLACLQARLAIGNGRRALLSKLFAIEYATLFDVYNIGTAALGLPMALGGTSNHFRVSALRSVGGWDAWNVTEDADLGLRFERSGFRVGSLDSTTIETAPTTAGVWMKQRRRWMKGWMQTMLVLGRDTRDLRGRLGWKRSACVALMLVNLLAGPILLPVFSGVVLYRWAVSGMAQPHGLLEIAEATLYLSVLLLGIGSTIWSAYVGVRARRLETFLPALPLIFPYQLMISIAGLMGLADLVKRPYHWHKTPHQVG